jgi:hypothetical protein
MPLFMDIHETVPEGVTLRDVIAAHEADLKVQGEHGVRYLKFWYNEDTGKVFCLAEAPNAEAAVAVHRESHGLVADHIFEVVEG